MIHPRLRLRDRNSKAVTWPNTAESLSQNLRWRRGRPQETYHLPSQNPGVMRPEQLFFRPYGNSRGADHYVRSVPEGRLRGERAGEGGRKPMEAQNPADSVQRRPLGES